MQDEDHDVGGQPNLLMQDDERQDHQEQERIDETQPRMSHTQRIGVEGPAGSYDRGSGVYGQGEKYFRDIDQEQELQQGDGGKEREVEQEQPRESGKTERSYPKLRTSGKPVVTPEFQKKRNLWYFKDKDGEKITVRKRDWSKVDYDGCVVYSVEGRRTIHIAEDMPS